MRLVLFFLILCFFSHSLHCEIITLFKVKEIKLEYYDYPWHEEIHLQVEGEASDLLENCFLTVSLFHGKNRVRWFNILLTTREEHGKFLFSQSWGPLNNAIEQVLSGSYLVQVEFILSNQHKSITEKLKPYLTDKQIACHEKKFYIGTPEKYQQGTGEAKNFYISSFQDLNSYFWDFSPQRDKFLNNTKNRDALFSFQQWNKKVSESLRKKKEELENFQKKCFSLYYPKTHQNVQNYCDFLQQMVKSTLGSLYQYYKKGGYYDDSYDKFYNYARCVVYRFHTEMAEELEMDIEKAISRIPFNPKTFHPKKK